MEPVAREAAARRRDDLGPPRLTARFGDLRHRSAEQGLSKRLLTSEDIFVPELLDT
jgi:hypothetical protein